MYEIIPHLYLSNFKDAEKLQPDREIFVINCTNDLPIVPTAGGGTRLCVDDHPDSEHIMTENIPLMIKYIDDHVQKNYDVLVHCYAGQQRSAAVIASYLIKTRGFSYDEAVEFIKSKKDDAFWDGVHFEESIKAQIT